MNPHETTTCFGMTLFNKAEFLPKSMESILQQTYSNFGLIAIDNASTDNTSEIMNSYVKKDPRIDYTKNSSNIGLIENWKKAFYTALSLYPKMEYFAWASDHDIWHKDWLSKHVDVLNTNRNAVLAYPIVEPIDEYGNKIPLKLPSYQNTNMSKYNRMISVSTRMKGVGNMIYGLFRTELLLKAGVHPYCIMPDRSMLLEIALYGSFIQVEEPLWQRRYFKTNVNQENLSVEYQEFLHRQRSIYFHKKVPAHAYFPTLWHGLRLILRTVFNPKCGLQNSVLGFITSILLIKRRRREVKKELISSFQSAVSKLRI